jgi:hypothetical protein
MLFLGCQQRNAVTNAVPTQVFNEGGEAFVIAYDDKTRDVVGISEKPEAQPGARCVLG